MFESLDEKIIVFFSFFFLLGMSMLIEIMGEPHPSREKNLLLSPTQPLLSNVASGPTPFHSNLRGKFERQTRGLTNG